MSDLSVALVAMIDGRARATVVTVLPAATASNEGRTGLIGSAKRTSEEQACMCVYTHVLAHA